MTNRELDALIAKHVFGWTHIVDLPCWRDETTWWPVKPSLKPYGMEKQATHPFGVQPSMADRETYYGEDQIDGVALLNRTCVPFYSSEIAAAFDVWKAMGQKLFSVRRAFHREIQIYATKVGGLERGLIDWPDVMMVLIRHDVLPLAITRATLLAVGVDVGMEAK